MIHSSNAGQKVYIWEEENFSSNFEVDLIFATARKVLGSIQQNERNLWSSGDREADYQENNRADLFSIYHTGRKLAGRYLIRALILSSRCISDCVFVV